MFLKILILNDFLHFILSQQESILSNMVKLQRQMTFKIFQKHFLLQSNKHSFFFVFIFSRLVLYKIKIVYFLTAIFVKKQNN